MVDQFNDGIPPRDLLTPEFLDEEAEREEDKRNLQPLPLPIRLRDHYTVFKPTEISTMAYEGATIAWDLFDHINRGYFPYKKEVPLATVAGFPPLENTSNFSEAVLGGLVKTLCDKFKGFGIEVTIENGSHSKYSIREINGIRTAIIENNTAAGPINPASQSHTHFKIRIDQIEGKDPAAESILEISITRVALHKAIPKAIQ